MGKFLRKMVVVCLVFEKLLGLCFSSSYNCLLFGFYYLKYLLLEYIYSYNWYENYIVFYIGDVK